METKKTFDTVAMVREIREAHHERTRNMTDVERLAFYRDKGKTAQEELQHLAAEMHEKAAS